MRIFFLAVLFFSANLLWALGGDEISIQSNNMPDRFVRHHDSAVELAIIEMDSDPADFCFIKTKGLDGTDSVSFESKNSPGNFLRHRNFQVVLEANDGSEVFKKDASFRVKPGLADSSGSSFESVNNAGLFLRHKKFRLFLEAGEDDLFRQDCTFTISKPVK